MIRHGASPSGQLSRLRLWSLVILAAIVWFAPLNLRDLAHPDEGRYSEISREMVATGDWVTPRLNGLKYFEKPPLQYWATAASFELFGESDFSARLWVAIAGFCTVLIVSFTAVRLWGAEAGLYTGLVAYSMTWMFGLGHIVTLDMSVTLFLTLALCSWLLGERSRFDASARRRWLLLMWAAMAGATLSKGLIGVLIPGASLFLYSLLARQWSVWRRLEWLWGLPLFCLLVVPWFVLVSQRNPEFAQFFFVHEHVERFLTTEHRREGAFYYFIPVLVGGLLPWTTLFPSTLRFGWTSDVPLNRLLLLWCLFTFVFFSFSGSKLPAYILPMFPAIAMVLGQRLSLAPADVLRRHAASIAVLWSLVAVIAPIVLSRYATKHAEASPVFALWVLAAAIIHAVLAGIAEWAARRHSKHGSVLALCVGSVAALTVITVGYQAYSPDKSARQVAALMKPYLGPETEVFSVKMYNQTLPYYLKRPVTLVAFTDEFALGQQAEPEKWISDLPAFAQRWRVADHPLALMSRSALTSLAAEDLPIEVLLERPRYVVVRKP